MSDKIKSFSKSDFNSTRSKFACLDEWLQWQASSHFTAIELGLERCRRVADNMGLLNPGYTVISVAGTNGKGSSITLLDGILRSAGYKVGRYTSPHLLKYNERICINGEQVSDNELCESFEHIDEARGDTSLTYFEFGTLAALDLFRKHAIELALLEVGLGGRLDAVNILDANVALITSIDIDHQQWLGNDRESIAKEKAGILRNKAIAVCSDPNPPQSLLDYASALDSPLKVAGRDYDYTKTEDSWSWSTKKRSLNMLPIPIQHCDFQLQNAAGVLMLLDSIQATYPVNKENIIQGLNCFRIAGRMQIVPDKITTILDVAHNAQSVQALVQSLNNIPCTGQTHLLIGMLKDKEHSEILKRLSEVADSWSIVTLSQERGSNAEDLLSDLSNLGIDEKVTAFDDVEQALANLYKTSTVGDRIVVTGSFLTVGAVLETLNGKLNGQ